MSERIGKKQRRAQILEAATTVFARQGYHGATIGDIASEAGVAQGTTYLYFKSKEDLLVAIFREKMGLMIDHVRNETEKAKGSEAKLRRLIATHVALVDEHRDLAQLILIELPQAGKRLQSDVMQPNVEYARLIEGILAEGIADGSFRADLDSRAAATMLLASVEGVATRWVLEEFAYSIQTAAETISNVFLAGVTSPSI